MKIKIFSHSHALPVLFAIATGALTPSATTLAAGHSANQPASHAKAASKKAAPHKMAASSPNAWPPLAAESALAADPPALPAKAWLVMDFDSGQLLASANADEALPPASLTKMMTSYLVEQALRLGKLKPTDLVSVS